jgi:FKBP-type peptidyl-prolyl cis-trans isomerase FkpA
MKFKRIISVITGALFTLTVHAQNNQSAPGQPALHFKKLNPQLQYAFVVDKPTSTHPLDGDQVMLNMQAVCNNRLMFSTAQQFKGKPGVYGVAKPAFKGDLIEAIMQMTPGDSIVCLVNADSLFKNSKSKMPDFIKHGDKVQYFIKLVSIKPKVQVQKEQQAAFMKQLKEQQAKQKAAEAKQLLKDDKELKTYFANHHITPLKTASGLYYTIKQEGSGDKALVEDSVTMNYTGTLLNGTTFDSNTDTAFHHVQPFQFVLGKGAVIKGWDEGVALLKTGSKATFYIPSTLAYGQRAMPGSGANPKGIPANSILLFDVELLSSKHPEPKPVSVKTASADSLNVPLTKPAVK